MLGDKVLADLEVEVRLPYLLICGQVGVEAESLRHLDDEGRKMLVERLSSYGNSAPKVEPLDIDKALKLPTLTDITEYAISCHRNTNHKYDGTKPYGHHLSMVEKVANEFQHLLGMTDTFNVIAACYCHDLIEDTRETYNDVLKRTNKEIADMVGSLKVVADGKDVSLSFSYPVEKVFAKMTEHAAKPKVKRAKTVKEKVRRTNDAVESAERN